MSQWIMSEEREYYIQDTRSYHGNAVIWWRKNSSGYTPDISDAGLYTKEEARRIEALRGTDKPWHKDAILHAIKRYVDAQLLHTDCAGGQ